jgi:hypothetical protein
MPDLFIQKKVKATGIIQGRDADFGFDSDSSLS